MAMMDINPACLEFDYNYTPAQVTQARTLIQEFEGSAWSLGDLLLEIIPVGVAYQHSGVKEVLEKFAQELDCGVDAEYLDKFRQVAAKWPEGTRIPSLCWSAHRYLPPAQEGGTEIYKRLALESSNGNVTVRTIQQDNQDRKERNMEEIERSERTAKGEPTAADVIELAHSPGIEIISKIVKAAEMLDQARKHGHNLSFDSILLSGLTAYEIQMKLEAIASATESLFNDLINHCGEIEVDEPEPVCVVSCPVAPLTEAHFTSVLLSTLELWPWFIAAYPPEVVASILAGVPEEDEFRMSKTGAIETLKEINETIGAYIMVLEDAR